MEAKSGSCGTLGPSTEFGLELVQGSSYQRLMVAQPIKLGGCGLRSLAELRHSAFVRGVEQAVPFLVPGDNGRETLCPALEQVVGSMAGERRWEEFLTAGSRTSREFGTGGSEVPSSKCVLF